MSMYEEEIYVDIKNIESPKGVYKTMMRKRFCKELKAVNTVSDLAGMLIKILELEISHEYR